MNKSLFSSIIKIEQYETINFTFWNIYDCISVFKLYKF